MSKTIEARTIKKGKQEKDAYVQTKSDQIRIPSNITIASLKIKLAAEKKEDIRYQSRRWGQWDENYLLFRDTVELNRLTQRQAVNVPLIKETVKTVMSKLQDYPTLYYRDRGGDEDKDIACNEFWRDDADKNRLDLVDTVDKKQVILYGRTHTKHNLKNGRWVYEIKDIRDVVVDKKTKPIDIQTARHIEELNIWKPLAEIVNDERYDKQARLMLSMQGITGENTGGAQSHVIGSREDAQQRDERLLGLGVDIELLDESAYESMVELTQHFTEIWDAEKLKYVRYVVLTSGYNVDCILRAEPLIEAIGIDEWPFDTWADDLEATDYWSDGIADSIRAINQTINIWVSQLIENRTLKNFGMNFYDSTASEGFTPQGYEPRPGGWYPLPGKPNEVYQNVKIDSLDSVIEDIQFLVSLAEKASATGAIDKGVVEAGKRTLGEIEIAVSKSMERTTAMALYYKHARKDMGTKWYSINKENIQDTQAITLYKPNSEGKLKGITLKRSQWVSDEGYQITVESAVEKLTENTDELIRLQAVKQLFLINPPLDEAIQKRAIAIVKLSPGEQTAIMDFEKKKKSEAEEAIKKNMGGENEAINPEAKPENAVMEKMGAGMGGGMGGGRMPLQELSGASV